MSTCVQLCSAVSWPEQQSSLSSSPLFFCCSSFAAGRQPTSRSSSSFTAHSIQFIITLAAPITDGVKHRLDVCLSVCLSVYYVPAAVQQQRRVSVDQEKFTHVNSNRNSLFEHLSGLCSSIIVANAILILLSMQFFVSKLLTK